MGKHMAVVDGKVVRGVHSDPLEEEFLDIIIVTQTKPASVRPSRWMSSLFYHQNFTTLKGMLQRRF